MEFVSKHNKWVAAIGTILVHGLLLLLFFVVSHTTPIPPYPEGTSPGLEINWGNYVEGTGNVENDQMGNEEPSAIAETQPTSSAPVNPSTSEASYVTNDAEESIALTNTSKPQTKKEETVEQPKERQVSQELQNLLSTIRNKKKAGNSGGDGNSGNAGNEGSPDGNPNTNGRGGSGGDPFGWELSGRKIMRQPDIADDSQEEGKVVVAITVDESGRVTKAEPGQRGTTTTSSILWTKARQAALSTQFNPSPEGAKEQRGTMTFVFVLN